MYLDLAQECRVSKRLPPVPLSLSPSALPHFLITTVSAEHIDANQLPNTACTYVQEGPGHSGYSASATEILQVGTT